MRRPGPRQERIKKEIAIPGNMRLTPTRPPGEDFFLINVIIPTPADACFDYGKVFTGSWLGVTRLLRFFLSDPTVSASRDPDAPRGRSSKAQVRVYQGRERVRSTLNELRRQRALRQAMKDAQANN
jgi:hypothetical protein